MVSAIQNVIDDYIRSHTLRTVEDILYIPQDGVAVIIRRRGYRNVSVDVNETASPSEALEKIVSHVAVY